MNNYVEILWWAVPVVVVLLLYKFVLRVFFGMVIVPDDRIGLVIKKYALTGEKRLPDGRIVAINGEAGMQARALAPGLYWRMRQATRTLRAAAHAASPGLGWNA